MLALLIIILHKCHCSTVLRNYPTLVRIKDAGYRLSVLQDENVKMDVVMVGQHYGWLSIIELYTIMTMMVNFMYVHFIQ